MKGPENNHTHGGRSGRRSSVAWVLFITAIFTWAGAWACATTGGRGVSGQRENDDPLDQAHALWLMIVGEQAQLERALDSMDQTTCAGICTSVQNLFEFSRLLCDLAIQRPETAALSSLCHDGRTRAQQARQRARDAGCPCSE